MRPKHLAWVAALMLPIGALVPVSVANAVVPAAGTTTVATPTPTSDVTLDVKNEDDWTLEGKKLDVPTQYTPKASPRVRVAAASTPAVGTVRSWIGLDDANGFLYRKDYTLRGVGDKIEVWVANDISFLPTDCRNQIASSTDVTDAQVADLIHEFDTNMYPKETAAFSTPPDRDGSNALLSGDYTGDGDNTVALIDNVRDDNYYSFPEAPTYIAGFFSSQFNELLDRNVMTIDAYDWAHRTGTNPPDEPTDDLCTSRPARPRLYEGTFAHEWQHLLEYYADPSETTWVNEGLSDFAQTLVGYVNAAATISQYGNDSHVMCYQGWGSVQTPYNTNPRDCGGPENSLSLWGESPNPNAVLADYGAAYQFMLFLYDRYGSSFMSTLHRDAGFQGIEGVNDALEKIGAPDVWSVLHDFQLSTLLDATFDTKKGKLHGLDKDRVTSASVTSSVNFANPNVNITPGAAPNGADYVLAPSTKLQSLHFAGAATLPTLPLQWTVKTDDPDSDGPVLWSGNESNLNVTAVATVTVPTSDPTLTFDAKYGAEATYDYAYVVVSTDGGQTYTPIAGDKTIDGPLGYALNGTTAGFEPRTFDLSAYAGQSILLGWQYVSDGGVNEGGFEVDNIVVGGTLISDGSSLAPFRSTSEILPTPVYNWHLAIVGYNEGNKQGRVAVYDGMSALNLGRSQLASFSPYGKVVVVVSYDEPTELVQQYAPYTLTINGTVMPGGSA